MASRTTIERLWSFLALSLFVLLTGGYALPALHFALVTHEVCREHGELRHTGAPEIELSGNTSDYLRSLGSIFAASTSHDQHDHCGVSAVSAQNGALCFGACARETSRSAPVASSIRTRESASSSVPLLAYAPKLAPPV